MGSIWDDIDLDTEEDSHDYRGALQLIAKVLARNHHKSDVMDRKLQQVDRLIDTELLDSMETLNLDNELELSTRLQKLSDKMEEYHKNSLLKGRTVIGVGGQFSAGKSAFINSLFGTDILPENLTPTTSISTYFLAGQKNQIAAYTRDNKEIQLTLEEMQALTHEFKRLYDIGFARFIKNMLIVDQHKASDSCFEHLAFLDTPGYSKADDGVMKKQGLSDYEQAQSQLQAVDYLIWLIDPDTTLTQSDIDFLESLHTDCPILVVFTKADKQTDEKLKAQISNAQKTLKQANINLYAVTSYSSPDAKEYFGETAISRFLKKAAASAVSGKNIEDQIHDIADELDNKLQQVKVANTDLNAKLRMSIVASEDIQSIGALVGLCQDVTRHDAKLVDCLAQLQNVRKAIRRGLTDIGKKVALN